MHLSLIVAAGRRFALGLVRGFLDMPQGTIKKLSADKGFGGHQPSSGDVDSGPGNVRRQMP